MSLLFITILTIGAISASDIDDNQVTGSVDVYSDNDEIINNNDVIYQDLNDNINEVIKEEKTVKEDDTPLEITQENYNDYFTSDVYTAESDNIVFSGQITGKDMIFASPVTVSSKDENSKLYNVSIQFIEGSSGSKLSNLYINNTDYSESVISSEEVTGITITDNVIIQKNDEGKTYAIKLNMTNDSFITNNNITVNGMEYDISYYEYGTLGVGNFSAIQGFKSSYNKISNNNISIKADKVNPRGLATTTTVGIEFMASAYSYDDDDSAENTLSSNNINIEGINYAYAIKLSNKIDSFIVSNNTINSKSKNAYGIEYAYGSDGEIKNNYITLNATDLSFGIIVTTNSMGTTSDNLVEANTIIAENASITYLIELYGARSTTVKNNNLTGSASVVEGIATSVIDRSTIINNNITITGNTDEPVVGNVESIQVVLTGINMIKATNDITITGNYINVTDMANGEIYTIIYNGTGSTIENNELYSSYQEGHKSIDLASYDNVIGNNQPINPDAIKMSMNSIAVEIGDNEELIVEVTDIDGNILNYGNVTFLIGDEVIGTSPVKDSEASINFAGEEIGVKDVTARYELNTVYLENTTTAQVTTIAESTYNGIIYVSTEGNDVNYGQEDSPKKTIKAAVKAATKEGASKQIIILSGTYDAVDLVINSELTITGQGEVILDAKQKGKVFEITDGPVTISDVTFVNGNSPRGSLINATAELTLINCNLENSTETVDGGALRTNAKTTVTNTTFKNNQAVSYGAAIYRVTSTQPLLVEDSKFINNSCPGSSGNGGAIYASGTGNVTIDNSLFEDNYARQATVYSTSNITIANSEFNNNGQENGSYNSADLYFSNANVNLENITSTGAKSRNQATFLYFTGTNNNLTAKNITIKENNGTNGIIYINSANIADLSDLNITDSYVKTNAIIYVNNGKNITFTNAVFEDNNSTNRFLYMNGAATNFTITDSKIINNNAKNFIENRGNVTITNTLFENNIADNYMFFKKYNAAAKYYLNDNQYNGNALATEITTTYEESENLIGEPISFDVEVTVPELDTKVNGGTLDVYVNDVLQNTYEVNDVVTVTIIPNKQINNVKIEYSIENNDYATNSTTLTVNTVSNVDSQIEVILPETISVGDKINLTAQVTNKYGNVTGGKVIFKVNGKTVKDENGKVIYAKVTDGIATIEDFEVTQDLTDKFEVQAVYSGTTKYNKVNSDVVEVELQNEINVSMESLTADKESQVTIVVEVQQNGNDLNSGKVVLKINGKTVKDENGKVVYAKVLNGQAVFNYTIPDTFKSQDYEMIAVYINGADRVEKNATLTVN